jgi:hypothetical protein
MSTHICTHCSEKFEGRKKKFCSPVCRELYHRQAKREASLAYYYENREARRAYQKRYQNNRSEAQRAKGREASRRWAAANKDYIAEYQARWNGAYWANDVSPAGQQVMNIFEMLEPAQREDYAEWLLFLAGAESRYAQVIKNIKVDDYVAAYAVSAG